ncbi:MAG: nitrite reductase small subunit NirD, partial [Planctomycetota bacterium]
MSRGAIASVCAALGEEANFADVKKLTKAGSGCGGCEPTVKNIITAELEKMGAAVTNHLCEHFHHSRPELMALVKASEDGDKLTSFPEILAALGQPGYDDGCEICKPAVASILASLDNGVVLSDGRDALQDTNDRSLANMQRGGSYSVVPRVPGGEITPAALIGMGQVAEKYGLYTKVTGAQRIDLFGAAKHELPSIWEELGKHGFESGHAYGKALRTVKSCVGSSWCRYGVQNSVDFAITVENRYKGLRAPHKLKSAVSGCIRECAEAQTKDFGIIAVDSGYDLYVCGNGGASPRHAALLATSLDEETTLKYIDRFLMYYVLTGERLERTARWFERLGPNDDVRLKALQDVVIHDSLGLNAEFEARMDKIVETYHDEWAVVVNDPELRAKFKQFANTDETQPADEMIEFMEVRGQRRPVDWPADGAAQTNWRPPEGPFARSQKSWVPFGPAAEFPVSLGTPVLYGESQLAIFHTVSGEWFATQNMCPHKQAFVLAQGVIGLSGDAPKVACPLHKKQFGLKDGKQLDGDLEIITFPVRIVDGQVQIELTARDEVDAVLSTSSLKVTCPSSVSADYNQVPK